MESERSQEKALEAEKRIDEARTGYPDALGRLLDAYGHYLLFVAKQELASALRAKIAPSDIVQDTLLEAARDFSHFRGKTEEELLSWLRRILRNNLTNIHRYFNTKKRRVEREIALQDVGVDALLHSARKPIETPSAEVQAREQEEELQRALRELPEYHRQVLLLHALEGLTFVRIAEKLDRTPDAIRKLWGRVVEELSKRLESPHQAAT